MPIRISFAAAGALFVLTGCQTIDDVTGNDASRAPTEQDRPQMTAPSPAAPASAAANSSLTGMGAERLLSLWGEPALRRKDIGSEIWQFGNGKCSVLVYVYPTAQGPLTVSHAEAVPGGRDEASISNCAKSNGLPSLGPVS
jgi:hypothetical protein